jgi:arginine decarboxylase
MILLNGHLVDPVDLRLRLDLVTTTSPSALLYGSIDGFRRRMLSEGRQQLDAVLGRANHLRARLGKIAGLEVMDESILGHDGVAEWDPLKLSVDVSGLGVSGYQAKEWMHDRERLFVQLGDARRVVCSLTYSDNDVAIDRLASAFERLATDPPSPDRPAPAVPPLHELDLEQAMSPREAYFADTEQVADPTGRISAEMISPYPPGVPVVLPGERIDEAVVDYLRAGRAAGMVTPDASDPTMATFRVVRH